jgi:tight adherence protein B
MTCRRWRWLFLTHGRRSAGIAWVFIYPLLSGEKKAEQRRAAFARPSPRRAVSIDAQRSRREQVEESLKEVESGEQGCAKLPIDPHHHGRSEVDEAAVHDLLRRDSARSASFASWIFGGGAAAGARHRVSPPASGCRAGC